MQITNFVNDKTVIEAARLLMKHSNDVDFLRRVEISGPFTETANTPTQVAELIDRRIDVLEITVKPYKTFNPWSKVIGHAKGSTIYINTRKLNLPLKDRVANLMHECLHLIGYRHRGNENSPYNQKTVPYAVPRIFADYVMEVKDEAA